MVTIHNPRSVLHALQPIELGTGEVESLLSYFCRLAVSHSTSTLSLSRAIAQRFEYEVEEEFDWFHRQLSGLGNAALTWSGALSALTSIPRLDRLTFMPWHDVISQNGLPIISKGQFCPHCLADDLASGKTPYFRLAWELKAVSVCHKHGSRLRQTCPGCGKDHVRHAASFVVPGWCTRCGSFLGDDHRDEEHAEDIAPVESWRAAQVHELIRAQQTLDVYPTRLAFVDVIEHIVNEMDGGQASRFAHRIGLSKSTVHYWLQSDNKPSLSASLDVCSQSGFRLAALLQGKKEGWTPPSEGQQLGFAAFKTSSRQKCPVRTLDWEDVDVRLQVFLRQPTPVSVREVSRQLGIEVRQLYLRDNETTRKIGQRWLDYRRRQKESNVQAAIPQLEKAAKEATLEGKSLNLREVSARLPPEVVQSVNGLFGKLKSLRSRLSENEN